MKFKKTAIIFICLLLVLFATVFAVTYYKVRKICSRSTHRLYGSRRAEGAKIFKEIYKAEELTLSTKDGMLLSAYRLIRPNARRVILFCHGFWQAKELLYPLAGLFCDDTLLFLDFRTHGSSQGRWISYGYHESQDVHAILKYIKDAKETAGLPVYAVGLSMGSASILKAAYEGAELNGVVIDSGFASLNTQVCRLFTRMTGMPSCFFSFTKCLFEYTLKGTISSVEPLNYTKDLSMPVLIFHSTDDRTVPVEDAYALYDAAQGKKELWITSGMGHVQLYNYYPEKYKQKFDNFFNNN